MSEHPKRIRNKPDKFEPYSPGDKHKMNAERTKKSKELKKDRERKRNKESQATSAAVDLDKAVDNEADKIVDSQDNHAKSTSDDNNNTNK